MNLNNNPLIQGLYEAAKGVPDENNGISKFDEQKLRRFLNNQKMGRRNRDLFSDGEVKFHTCPRYDPCPICDKCRNKASHLYKECEECQIPICAHTYNDRQKMIKRENFIHYVDHDVMESIRLLDKEVCGNV
jgi:hypothetical protein